MGAGEDSGDGSAGSTSGAELLVIPTIQQNVQDNWERTLGVGRPLFHAAELVRPGQRFELVVILARYARDASGDARVEYDLELRGPDGVAEDAAPVMARRGLTALVGPAPAQLQLMLAVERPELVFDADAPHGRYTARVVVHDRVAGARRVGEATLELASLAEGAPFESCASAGQWLSSYYLAPDPARAITALASLEGEPEGERDAWWPAPVISRVTPFFVEVLRANPYLIPTALDGLARGEPGQRLRALEVLGVLDIPLGERASTLSGEELARYRSARDGAPDPLRDELAAPEHLDMLWAAFFATGRYAYIRRLVDALRFRVDLGASRRARRWLFRRRDDAAILREAIYRAAEWSLTVNARDHELVAFYLLHLARYDDTVPGELRSLVASWFSEP